VPEQVRALKIAPLIFSFSRFTYFHCMKQILLMLLIVCPFFAFTQIYDDFSDGNFTANPTWVGDDSLFTVNANFQLQSKGTPGISKDISLSTPAGFSDSTEWSCWVKFNLSPSTQNFCRFYLVSDHPNLKGSLNGYFVQFGGVTGNSDSITLYKQKGTSFSRIIAGRPSTVSKTTNTVRVKVLHDASGNWQLLSDTLGGANFISEGNGFDNEFTLPGYCGFFARYTSSNSSNFYFDDLYAGPKIIDTIPPTVDSLTIVNSTTLRLVFSEDLDTSSALDLVNYVLTGSLGNPVNVIFETGSRSVVYIRFAQAFTNGTSYSLTVSRVADRHSNILIHQDIPFSFYIPVEADILISEFLPDPTPVIHLPDQEFVELYNRSNFTIRLKGWTLTDGTTIAAFPDMEIKPDSFLIVCAESAVSLFSPLGKCIGLPGFPSLNNSGDLIRLQDPARNIIHQVLYDLSWYADHVKEDGGWSIELLNPFDLCKGQLNYAASIDTRGGTPGSVNSSWSKQPDTIPPQVLDARIVSSIEILLVFNEKMDSASLLNAAVSLSSGTTILSRNVRGILCDSLALQLAAPIPYNTPVNIFISDASDCNQNAIIPNSTKTIIYYLPDTEQTYDVVITELLPDPDPPIGLPETEFIELYNQSNRILSLKSWTIEDEISKAVFPDLLLFPDSFLILTSASGRIPYGNFGTTISLTNFPSLGNDGDKLVLKNDDGKIIHALHYTSDWYNDNVKKNGGWSLEIMDPKNPCAGKENWRASRNSKGGTPGKRNSIHALLRDKTPPKLVKAYPVDAKNIRLQFDEPLDSVSILRSGLIFANPFGKAYSVQLQPDLYTSFIAQFTDSFRVKNVYRILADSITDCAGNVIADQDYADFGIPEDYDSTDIIINELLFNPRSGGVDFVELYNRSDKVIDLQKLYIANANPDHSVKDMYPVSGDGFLLFPGGYCALTSDASVLAQQYFSAHTQSFIECSMPSFPDNSGTALIIDASGKCYDAFSYDENMHFALLTDKSGISLERIDMNRPTNDRTNWTSASTRVDATPAYRNSQFATGNANGEHLRVDPEVFSPDDDGYKDVTNVSYTLPGSGYTGNLYLFDSRGMLVKQLLKNELLGTSGTFSWNGITDKNEKAPIGIYIVYFEVFNLQGDVQQYRSTVVVGGRL
jgi:hypothetical protein